MYGDSILLPAPMPNIFDQLSRAGTVELLLALKSQRPMTFSAIRKMLGNSTTATRRVRELQGMSLISRQVLQDKLRTVEYRLTEKGSAVAELVQKLKNLA